MYKKYINYISIYCYNNYIMSLNSTFFISYI